MKNTDFFYNNIFKQIRLELGYTQTEYAKLLMCTQPQVSKIEKNQRVVTKTMIEALSELYKVDLNSIYDLYENTQDLEISEKYRKLLIFDNLTDSNMLRELEKELDDPLLDKAFNKGRLSLVKNLCHSVVQCYLHENFELAVEYALLNIEKSEEELYTYMPNLLKSQFFYDSITVLVTSYYKLQKTELALAICENFFRHYDVVYYSDFFKLDAADSQYKNQYLFFCVVYTYILFDMKNYERAIYNCDYVLKKCILLNAHAMITYSLFFKFRAYYKLEDIQQAKEVYSEFKLYSKYSGFVEQLILFTGFDINDYPLLLEE
ncbi:MAG: helix-turn-helix domain-containing protein [Anaerotignum sp.]